MPWQEFDKEKNQDDLSLQSENPLHYAREDDL